MKIMSDSEIDLFPWEQRIRVVVSKGVGDSTVSYADADASKLKQRVFRYLEKVGVYGAGTPQLGIAKTPDGEVVIACTIEAVFNDES